MQDKVSAEEAEVERLSLLLRWKAAQEQKIKLQKQLAEHEGITTPPHLAAPEGDSDEPPDLPTHHLDHVDRPDQYDLDS